MDVAELGEFGLIRRLQRIIGPAEDARLVVGIGDDAAVWDSRRTWSISTTDTMVENVHFFPGKVSWHEVGWKALAVNVSDIAAMGGSPACALVTLLLPPDMPVDHVDALYAGLEECAERYGVTVAGGDIVSSPFFAITVALFGDAAQTARGDVALLTRDAARVGDAIAVTGPLGGSVGGLRALVEGTALQHPSLVDRHMHIWPRVEAGTFAVAAGLRCGIDISDGLLQDLGHICEASKAGAEVSLDAIPVEETLRATYPGDAALMAATGGEDYELILVGRPELLCEVDGMLRQHFERETEQVHIIGRIVNGPNRVHLLDVTGREVEVASRGWDHLRRRGHA